MKWIMGLMGMSNPVAFYIIGAVIVALLAFSTVQTVRLLSAEAREAVAQEQVKTKEAQLQAQIAVVRQLAENGEQQAQRVETAQQEAERIRASRQRELDLLRKERAPVKCEEAVVWANEKAKQLSAGW